MTESTTSLDDGAASGSDGSGAQHRRWHSRRDQFAMRRVLPALICLGVGILILASASPLPLDAQPQPDALSYADGAVQIANGNGFRLRYDETKPTDEQTSDAPLRPSRYPPGFSLALAPFVEFGDNSATDTQVGSKFYVIVLLVLVFIAAWIIGGPWAALLAAVLTIAAPFTAKSARLVMADAFGAALTVGVLIAVLLATRESVGVRGQQRWYFVAGVLAGYGVLTRTGAIPTLIALIVAARLRPQMKAVLLGAAPIMIMLWTYQWTEFGNPLATGYNYHLPHLKAFGAEFVTAENLFGERGWIHADRLGGAAMRWTCPCDEYGPMGKASNLVFYPSVMLGLYWVFVPPFVPLLGVWELVRRRGSPAARFTILVVASNFLLVVPYFYQGARLVAPAAFLLLIYSAAGAVDLSERVVGRMRLRLETRRAAVA